MSKTFNELVKEVDITRLQSFSIQYVYVLLKEKLEDLWNIVRPQSTFQDDNKREHLLQVLLEITTCCKLGAEKYCLVKKEEATAEQQKSAEQQKIEELERTLQRIKFAVEQASVSDIQRGNSGNVVVDKNYILTLIKNVLDE